MSAFASLVGRFLASSHTVLTSMLGAKPGPINLHWTLVDTTEGVQHMLNTFISSDFDSKRPMYYFDLEGINLGRNGPATQMQLLHLSPTGPHAYLIDLHRLQHTSFRARGASGLSLKDLLESTAAKKAIFDVRNDAAALFHQFGVSVKNVDDIQLIENATRGGNFVCLRGLASCIRCDAPIKIIMNRMFSHIKSRGKWFFEDEDYSVLVERPMSEDLLVYCLLDVFVLPALWDTYSKKLNTEWRQLVTKETDERIRSAEISIGRESRGHKLPSPKSWEFHTRSLVPCQVASEMTLEQHQVQNSLEVMGEIALQSVSRFKTFYLKIARSSANVLLLV